MNTRKTKQKEIVYQVLCQMSNHPTIKELYDVIHNENPELGQATVYRNVAKLVEEGKILKISTPEGIEHYDANCKFHSHFLCSKCHRIFDIYTIESKDIMKMVDNSLHVSRVHVLLEGICNQCQSGVEK